MLSEERKEELRRKFSSYKGERLENFTAWKAKGGIAVDDGLEWAEWFLIHLCQECWFDGKEVTKQEVTDFVRYLT